MEDESDEYYKEKRFVEAARVYEMKAESTPESVEKVRLYQKAALAYKELGSTEDKVRCQLATIDYIRVEDRVNCLIECWRDYFRAVAVYQYEVSFEWKGEVNNLDPHYNERMRTIYPNLLRYKKSYQHKGKMTKNNYLRY